MTLMRKLDFDQKKLWTDQPKTKRPELVATSDCEPQLLSGWTDRDISLWKVFDIDGESNSIQILTAICRQMKNFEKICYLLFPEEVVTSAGLTLKQSPGKTGSNKVDSSGTHFEIEGITGKQLCTLIFNISNSEFQIKVFSKTDLNDILYKLFEESLAQIVVGSSNSTSPNISYSLSGSGLNENPSDLITEQPTIVASTQKKLPKPSSSTK